MTLRALLAIALLCPAVATAAKTQNAPETKPSSFHAEFVANLDDVQHKILALAEAIPAEKYSWRPSADIRSISEVFMHIVGGNYFLSTFLGAEAPKANGDMEKNITRKADVIIELKKSFDHLRVAANNASDLEKRVKMFGTDTTYRGVLVTCLSHLHEHLGQSIAYARMNGVAPPWSR